MAKQIQATGIELEEYEFVDKNGKHLFTIRFNSSDLDIVKRYDAVADWMNSVNIPENTEEENANTLFELSDTLKEKIDYLMNSSVSKEIFSVMNPFSLLASGQLYAENVMENIGNLIESEMNARTKRVRSRMGKHTAKYHK